MKEVKADYMIPNEAGSDYEIVHFSTTADQVRENNKKNFISNELKQHLINIQDKEVLKTDISNDINETSDNKIPSSQALRQISSLLGNGSIKIVVSSSQPTPEVGKTIIWIEDKVGVE